MMPKNPPKAQLVQDSSKLKLAIKKLERVNKENEQYLVSAKVRSKTDILDELGLGRAGKRQFERGAENFEDQVYRARA